MNAHDIFRLAGGALALALFVPLLADILKHGGAGQSFAMWALWAALDSILTVSIWQQRGNYLLTLGFVIGGVTLAAVLLRQGRFAWGRLETVVLLLVLACIAVWAKSGPRMATIAATAGIVVASAPGWLALWKNPDRRAAKIWLGYVLANVLGFFGGTEMTVEQRFAPGVFALLSALMALAGSRRGK